MIPEVIGLGAALIFTALGFWAGVVDSKEARERREAEESARWDEVTLRVLDSLDRLSTDDVNRLRRLLAENEPHM